MSAPLFQNVDCLGVEVPDIGEALWLAVVVDPRGNHLVLLDSTKGQLQTDDEQNVVGVGHST